MGGAALLIFYSSIVFFLAASTARLIRYARAPVHLRWEIYRRSSVLENPGWWTLPAPGLMTKLRSAISELAFTASYYYRYNRCFWYFMAVFHAGVYLLVAWHVWLLVASAVLGPETPAMVTLVWGHGAAVLVLVGGAGSVLRRLTNRGMRVCCTPARYVRWFLVMAALLGGFYPVYFFFGNSASDVSSYVGSQLQFGLQSRLDAPWPSALHLIVVSGWMFYLPFGHPVRVLARYYHAMRWDHVPNVSGGPVRSRVRQAMKRPLTWSAPHVGNPGNWGEVSRLGIPRELSNR